MSLTIEAVYENGVLKPKEPLPFKEHEKVRLFVHREADVQRALDAVQRSYGLLRWTGSQEDLEYLIHDIENDPLEAP